MYPCKVERLGRLIGVMPVEGQRPARGIHHNLLTACLSALLASLTLSGLRVSARSIASSRRSTPALAKVSLRALRCRRCSRASSISASPFEPLSSDHPRRVLSIQRISRLGLKAWA